MAQEDSVPAFHPSRPSAFRRWQGQLIVMLVVAAGAVSAWTGWWYARSSAALTGPVVRGDAEVVQAHVRALPPDVLPIYLALQQRVLAHAAARLPHPAVARVSAVLGPEAASRIRRPRRPAR